MISFSWLYLTQMVFDSYLLKNCTPHCMPLTLVFVRYYMLCKFVFGSHAWLSLFKLTSVAVIHVSTLNMLPISHMAN